MRHYFRSKIYHRSVQNLIMLAEGYIFQQATPEIENKVATPEIENKVIHQKRIQRICKQYTCTCTKQQTCPSCKSDSSHVFIAIL